MPSSFLLGHILIGAPGSGKTTLAQQWCARDAQLVWISTDRIREQLYGNAEQQGDWSQVEQEALQQVAAAIAAGKTVLYDATNSLRPWRIDLLQKFAQIPSPDGSSLLWLGWHLKTPLATCTHRNQSRDRQVPQWVIDRAIQQLKAFPPCIAEGFALVETVKFKTTPEVLEPDFDWIDRKIQNLPQSLQGRHHRYKQMERHYYSDLLHFDRLLHLIKLILDYPGLGQLRHSQPDLLQKLLKVEELPAFTNAVEEISAVMLRKQGKLYADPLALQGDLHWLQENHFVNTTEVTAPLQIRPVELDPVPNSPLERPCVAAYGDAERFAILLSTLRFLVHQPFLRSEEAGTVPVQQALLEQLQQDPSVPFLALDHLRRDIENVFKPYGFLERRPMRQGYVVGSSILQPTELLQLFQILEPQAIKLEDPLALATYRKFQERLQLLKLETCTTYPVRTILNQPIMTQGSVSATALANPRNLAMLELVIQQGEKIKLRKLRGQGRHQGDPEGYLEVWPIQLGYYNIGWYLGYQCCGDGRFVFDRLDRLEGLPLGGASRSKAERLQALKQLDRLQSCCYSLFLGNDAAAQQALLSPDPQIRSQVLQTFEIWCSDAIFAFISEGTQRFAKFSMSPPLGRSISADDRRKLFHLKPSGDPQFPHRLRAEVPYWVLESDYEFLAWLTRFGAKIKVHEPQSLRDRLAQDAAAVCQLYP